MRRRDPSSRGSALQERADLPETHGSSSNVIGQTSEAKDHPPANAISIDLSTPAKEIVASEMTDTPPLSEEKRSDINPALSSELPLNLSTTNATRKSSAARELDLDAADNARNDAMTDKQSSDMKAKKARVDK
ncbi:hypothetical protein EJB05_54265 [Eragrostis curvula]|uniref:Uncharacterized protein n=1 Tax=Eragrostis curvula TaxID=38414 RepID=A0A5J9SN22_9POAL|nr:hypothetical protein EJB05_54265 [Eragrostis curvula]